MQRTMGTVSWIETIILETLYCLDCLVHGTHTKKIRAQWHEFSVLDDRINLTLGQIHIFNICSVNGSRVTLTSHQRMTVKIVLLVRRTYLRSAQSASPTETKTRLWHLRWKIDFSEMFNTNIKARRKREKQWVH